jgi:hypothetical protein
MHSDRVWAVDVGDTLELRSGARHRIVLRPRPAVLSCAAERTGPPALTSCLVACAGPALGAATVERVAPASTSCLVAGVGPTFGASGVERAAPGLGRCVVEAVPTPGLAALGVSR